jgi:hypothetical protein
MDTSEKINFVFRQQPPKSSKYGILLTYITENQADMTRNERILHPTSLFWLPFAYQKETNLSQQELQQLARSCVYQLKLHIHYLEESFELNTIPIALEKTQVDAPELSTHHENEPAPEEVTEDFSYEDNILNRLT